MKKTKNKNRDAQKKNYPMSVIHFTEYENIPVKKEYTSMYCEVAHQITWSQVLEKYCWTSEQQ